MSGLLLTVVVSVVGNVGLLAWVAYREWQLQRYLRQLDSVLRGIAVSMRERGPDCQPFISGWTSGRMDPVNPVNGVPTSRQEAS